jgi:hypothetical protein
VGREDAASEPKPPAPPPPSNRIIRPELVQEAVAVGDLELEQLLKLSQQLAWGFYLATAEFKLGNIGPLPSNGLLTSSNAAS